MSELQIQHDGHKARLARLGAPPRYQAPIWRKPQAPKIEPQDLAAGWESMWFYDLVFSIDRKAAVPHIRDIQAAVARYFKISVLDILSQRRAVEISMPRHIGMYLARVLTMKGYPEIGRRFGDRDHTTVMHGVRKIGNLIGLDPKVTQDVEVIRRHLA
jgi:hypothetical protein